LREKYFKACLDFILSHFENPIWPRTIFTPKEKQVLVYSQDQALAKFIQARFLDCRINAYPSYTEWKGLNRQAPDFLFIDLDLSRFKSVEALNRALTRTLNFMRETWRQYISNCRQEMDIIFTSLLKPLFSNLNAFSQNLKNLLGSLSAGQNNFLLIKKQIYVTVIVCRSKIV